ncbi:hypothetical protein [Anabaena sp. CCY 9614]|uniref:hypothetical protein n=1 Tax=Anabaena sp. CCY 9614 TaxID=3103869 RepID=UPI0039C6D39B
MKFFLIYISLKSQNLDPIRFISIKTQGDDRAIADAKIPHLSHFLDPSLSMGRRGRKTFRKVPPLESRNLSQISVIVKKGFTSSDRL